MGGRLSSVKGLEVEGLGFGVYGVSGLGFRVTLNPKTLKGGGRIVNVKGFEAYAKNYIGPSGFY